MRHRFGLAVLSASMMAGVVLFASPQSQPVFTPATPENVASFLGIWTISANGSYGPITLTVGLRAVEGKVGGEVSDQNGKHVITDVSKAGASLVFSYVFDYNGNPIDAVVTLTPAEKTVDAYLDFAGGAAQYTGTAIRKP